MKLHIVPKTLHLHMEFSQAFFNNTTKSVQSTVSYLPYFSLRFCTYHYLGGMLVILTVKAGNYFLMLHFVNLVVIP